MSNILQELKEDKISLYKVCRYMYRIGNPILSDSAYDKLHEYMKDNYPYLKEVNQSYDDDDIPKDLILKYYGKDYLIETEDSEYLLSDEKSLSIKPLFTWSDIYNSMQMFKGKVLCISLKVDGVNQKSAYKKVNNNYTFLYSLSRGRKGNSRRYDNIKNIIPLNINPRENQDILDIRGEVVVDKEGREILKNNYSSIAKFSSAKSSALSMLTREYPKELYKYMHMYAFYCDSLSDTVYGTFTELENLGFNTPPHELIYTEDMPKDIDKFRLWLMPYFERMWKQAQERGIDSDGVVIEVNNLTEDFTVEGQYSDRAIACKVSYWENKYYKSKIVGFKTEQQRVKCSLRAIVEPVKTDDGSIITVVNIYNPDIAIRNNCAVGEYIYFERKSNTVTNLIYGEELEELLLS